MGTAPDASALDAAGSDRPCRIADQLEKTCSQSKTVSDRNRSRIAAADPCRSSGVVFLSAGGAFCIALYCRRTLRQRDPPLEYPGHEDRLLRLSCHCFSGPLFRDRLSIVEQDRFLHAPCGVGHRPGGDRSALLVHPFYGSQKKQYLFCGGGNASLCGLCGVVRYTVERLCSVGSAALFSG